MPPWCTCCCLYCIGWLGNVQILITRAEPLYDSLHPLFCDVFAAVVVCERSLLLWSVKSHDVDLKNSKRKIIVCINSGKEDNLVRYIQIFENFPGNFRSIWLSSRNFRNFRLNGSLFGNSTISLLSGTFPRKFPYHLSPFRKFRNFWWNGKRPCFHRYRKILSLLPSQCLNTGQPALTALNFPSNLFVRWESPLLEDLFLE